MDGNTDRRQDLYTEIDDENIAWLHFNRQESSTNVLSASVLEDFYREIMELSDRAPRGLVILSDKPNGFIAGADVREFTALENHDQALSGYIEIDALEIVDPRPPDRYGFARGFTGPGLGHRQEFPQESPSPGG